MTEQSLSLLLSVVFPNTPISSPIKHFSDHVHEQASFHNTWNMIICITIVNISLVSSGQSF